MSERGFLGPPGTFAEEALIAMGNGAGRRPYASIGDCFAAVAAGEVDEALVPIENSIEGSVNQTLDELARAAGRIVIRGETVHPVHHHLIGRPGQVASRAERVISHPQAMAQCRGYLRENLPAAHLDAANSTADAVRLVSESSEPWVAISTERAAEIYGCAVLAAGIEDVEGNRTRFVRIATDREEATGPGNFRTSIICVITRDRPGALLAILQEFALRAVNLSKLESRPAKTGLGRYRFFIDIDGSIDRDMPVAAAIQALEDQDVAHVTHLGAFRAYEPSG